MRQHPGGHQWRHIEVPARVPPVSTQRLGLLLVQEPSQRGAPWRLPLLAFTVDVAIQDAPGRLSHTCTRQRRGKHRDHTKEAVVSQQWSTGSSSTHGPALSATCIYLLRSQKVANYHGTGNSTLSRKDCDLVLLSCTSGTADCARAVKATCAWIWQFSLGDI